MSRPMRLALSLLALVVLAVIGLAVWFRLVPMAPEVWHVEPETAAAPSTPNYVLLTSDEAPRIPAPLAQVAARLHAIAVAEGATPIAGDLAEGHATYVVRSRLMGYPDAVSIRLSGTAEVTQVHIFSRSRFGQSDHGANAARVARWIDAANGP